MNDICATWPIGIERSVPAIVKTPVGKGDIGLHEMSGKRLPGSGIALAVSLQKRHIPA